MNAIILAAGKGARLRPLTNDKPKCLIDLFGKNVLRWQIDTYHECNIHDITVINDSYNANLESALFGINNLTSQYRANRKIICRHYSEMFS